MTPHEELKQLFAHRKPFDVAIEVSGFTGFRTTNLDDLTESEASQLLKIHAPTPKSIIDEYNTLKENEQKKTYMSAIIATAENERIKEPGSFDKFNRWMLKSSVFKKHLNAHSLEELKILLQQMKALKGNNKRSSQKPLSESWWLKQNKLKNLN